MYYRFYLFMYMAVITNVLYILFIYVHGRLGQLVYKVGECLIWCVKPQPPPPKKNPAPLAPPQSIQTPM